MATARRLRRKSSQNCAPQDLYATGQKEVNKESQRNHDERTAHNITVYCLIELAIAVADYSNEYQQQPVDRTHEREKQQLNP